jgi:hypothetical protein
VLVLLSTPAFAVTISGRVVDLGRQRSGIPAVEIKLQTYGDNATELSTHTDAAGNFKLTGVPRAARAKLTAVRRGYQNNPTTRLISTDEENAGDVFMIAEAGNAAYYREFAAEVAKAEASVRSELRAIWFNLPAADAALVKQQFAALGGDPQREHVLWAMERDSDKMKRDEEETLRLAGRLTNRSSSNGNATNTSGTMTSGTAYHTSSSDTGDDDTSTTTRTIARTRMRKD